MMFNSMTSFSSITPIHGSIFFDDIDPYI